MSRNKYKCDCDFDKRERSGPMGRFEEHRDWCASRGHAIEANLAGAKLALARWKQARIDRKGKP